LVVDRAPGDFGGKLRAARERRGVSLREIANATKIAVSVLEALERNDISRLPGGIFGRAFVRSYALEVGLDPEATIQEFIAQFPNDSVTVGHPTSRQVEDHEAVESDRRMAGTFLRLFLVSVPIAGAVLYFATAGRRDAPAELPAPATITPAPDTIGAVPAETIAPAPQTTPAAEPPPPTPASPPPSASAPAPARAEDPAQIAPPALQPSVTTTAADHLTVSITAKGPCWVTAIVDGRRVIDRLMQRGDRKTLEIARELEITAGDGAALALTLNGVNAKPLGKSGEVAAARLTLTNFKSYMQAR
jgi:cytoskeleton protein RodZ